MPQSRAEIQKRYREKKKAELGEEYLAKERARQKNNYIPVEELSSTQRKKRNEQINIRVRKHRETKRKQSLMRQNAPLVADEDQSTSSGYNTQESEVDRLLIVRFPNRRGGPRKRIGRALKAANRKLKIATRENEQYKKKVKTLQRRLQRLSKKKTVHDTPRSKTDQMLKASGVPASAGKIRKQLLFANVVLNEIKEKSQSKSRAERNRVYSMVTGNIVRKYRCIARLSEEIKASRRQVAAIIKKGIDFAKGKRRIRKKLAQSVTDFFEREDNSRMMPGKRDATKIGDSKVQTRFLTDYLGNLHEKYLAENPSHTISLTTFCRMRPKHVKLTGRLGRNVCLCTKHQNVALKLQMMSKCGMTIPQNPEKFLQNNCVIDETLLPDVVVYCKWKRVTLENNKKKMKVVTESLNKDVFCNEWKRELDMFQEHYETMREQYVQTRLLKDKLPRNEIIIHMDFAENYACKTADEIQSAYWNATQVTLHPMVVYYRLEDGSLAHKSYVAVSNELSHASGTVLTILDKLFHEEIDLPGCSEIQYVHYWTDSPVSQYRNRFIFNAVANHETLHGCPATWNYYEAGHGKNVCDGLGGTVKRLADEAVRSGKCTIQDADDFIKWAQESSMKEVRFFFVAKEECSVMAENIQNVEFQSIKGTLKIHSVKLDTDGNFCTRSMSCYCDKCIDGLICDSWSCAVPGNGRHTDPDDDSGKKEKYATGDFVAAQYEQDWFIGKILCIDDDGEKEITFLEKKKAMFQWPNREDILWVKDDQIVCKISPPVSSGKSARMLKLCEDDLQKIELLYSSLQKRN